MKLSHIPMSEQQFIANSSHSGISKDSEDCIINRKINRRQFLKTGTSWMVALTTASCLMKSNSAYGGAIGIPLKASRIVSVAFKTDKDLVRKMVPNPLKANDEGLLYAIIGRFNSVYNQAWLKIPVSCAIPESGTTREVKGSFFLEMYDNRQVSVSYGKSVYGYPKQLADINYTESKDSIEGSVKHQGRRVARIKFSLPGKKQVPLSFNEYERHFNFKSIKGSRRLAIIRWADYKEHKRRSGEVEIEPFGIEVHKVLEATFKIADWVVPYEPTVFMEYILGEPK